MPETVIVLSDKAQAIIATPAPSLAPAFADMTVTDEWWVATVASSLEKRADVELRKAGVETFLPLRAVEITNARIKTLVSRGKMRQPYRTVVEYPGYVLVRAWTERAQFWHAVRACRHVHGIMTNQSAPLRVSTERVAEIAASLTCSVEIEPSNERFAVGQPVVISPDDLCSYNGTVERKIGTDKLRILIDMLGGKRPVDISADRVAFAR